MNNSRRAIKKKLGVLLLESEDITHVLAKIESLPLFRVVNALFTFLYDTNEKVRWRAVSVMGRVVSVIADNDIESARVIVRRLMWNLNDESGGIGWGSVEAMGEILALHRVLADEYANILISYIKEDANYQEHEIMQRGVLWAIGRLAQVRPELAGEAIPFVIPFLDSGDQVKRGLSAWIMGLLKVKRVNDKLVSMLDDDARLHIYCNYDIVETTVRDIVLSALTKIHGR